MDKVAVTCISILIVIALVVVIDASFALIIQLAWNMMMVPAFHLGHANFNQVFALMIFLTLLKAIFYRSDEK